jgi:hypothetical protein
VLHKRRKTKHTKVTRRRAKHSKAQADSKHLPWKSLSHLSSKVRSKVAIHSRIERWQRVKDFLRSLKQGRDNDNEDDYTTPVKRIDIK